MSTSLAENNSYGGDGLVGLGARDRPDTERFRSRDILGAVVDEQAGVRGDAELGEGFFVKCAVGFHFAEVARRGFLFEKRKDDGRGFRLVIVF